jgi:hypothetical protein
MKANENVGNKNKSVPSPHPQDFDTTLRLIATVPAPEGLEDRVHARLRSTPRTARILEWPAAFRTDSAWMRSAAAAAIAFVVVGGGWGVYSRVQPNKVIAMPPHVAAPGGFSNAGAMRTPQTLNGPVLEHPANAPAAPGAPASNVPSPAKISAPQVIEMPARKGQAAATPAKAAVAQPK